MLKECIGEFIGTFIIVLFGCGSIALAIFFEGVGSLFEVALIWGFGVAIAIFSTRNICPAHLNPAVSLAMYLSKKLSLKRLPFYIFSQTFGAFAAAAFLYFIFYDAITVYETTHNIVRGSSGSVQTAQMFGEYFPNPGFADKVNVSVLQACLMECFGTFLLVFVIFRLTNKHEQVDNSTPILIGLSVTIIICLIAPFTQAGINPARDFGPRIFAYFTGWGDVAFPTPKWSFLTVYIISPLLGGVLASITNKLLR